MNLDIIRERYHRSLGSKRAAIENAWQALRDAQNSDECTASALMLIEESHRMSGSAGMYGYEDIASAARALEKSLLIWHEEHRQRDDREQCDRDAIEPAVEALTAAIASRLTKT